VSADTFDVLDGVLHGLGPVGEGRRRVHARHGLGDARAGINPEHFLDELMRQPGALRSQDADTGRGDFVEKHPAFAVEAGLAVLRWFIQGYGYEITSADMWAAYSHTMKAGGNVDGGRDIQRRVLALIDSAGARGGFVASIIGRE
jgi:hypothetical protein